LNNIEFVTLTQITQILSLLFKSK